MRTTLEGAANGVKDVLAKAISRAKNDANHKLANMPRVLVPQVSLQFRLRLGSFPSANYRALSRIVHDGNDVFSHFHALSHASRRRRTHFHSRRRDAPRASRPSRNQWTKLCVWLTLLGDRRSEATKLMIVSLAASDRIVRKTRGVLEKL